MSTEATTPTYRRTVYGVLAGLAAAAVFGTVFWIVTDGLSIWNGLTLTLAVVASALFLVTLIQDVKKPSKKG